MARNIEKEYQKLTPEQAVLHRPASYIGSTNGTVTETWIPKNNKMKYKPVKYNPGLLKCFDELITNAFDASKRDKTVKNIKITILADNMSVWNDGELGIPIQIHKEHNVYLLR
jgi:DNA topoisomerase-2